MDRRRTLIIILIIVGSLLAALGSILINVATSQSLPNLKLSLPLLWFLVGIVTFTGICVAVLLHHLQTTSDRKKSKPESQNRQRMLEKVHAFWIKGVLEKSLHGAALITLGLHEQRDAVATPWRLVLQQIGWPERLLPSGTRITQVYDDEGGELLILGEPGSGKTTLLLELARDLLERAKHDETRPMPVVFNLSSWAAKRQSITQWLVEELNVKYQVPRKLGQSWVNDDQILPLLDGLDEVSSPYRTACLEAINAYRREHGLVPTVVCSRSAEYLAQTTRVLLRSAVMVQPLTVQQIDEYLLSTSGQMESLHVALHDDTGLQEMAATPLMLSILTLVYHGKSIEDIAMSGSPETRRQQVFAIYVQRMLERRGIETRYTSQRTLHWLAWLAHHLTQRDQTEFFIESMQPDWLRKKWSRLAYYVAVGLNIGLWIALGIGLVGGLLGGLIFGLIFGLSSGLLFGLFGLLLGLLLGGLSIWLSMRLVFVMVFGLAGMIVGMLLGGLISGLGGGLIGIPIGLLFGGLVGTWIFGLHIQTSTGIKPAEVLIWSWVTMQRNLVTCLVVGLSIALVLGLVSWLLGRLFDGLLSGLGIILIAGLLGGLSVEMLDKQTRIKPNQGIWRSAQNSTFIGLIFGLTGGLSCGLLGGPIDAVLGGLGGALGGGLTFGGIACLQHIILRLLLWMEGSIPLNYVHFLDYAAERILLRKVGGGYIFVHRLLLEYFASLNTIPTFNAMTEPLQHASPAL